MSKIKEVFSTLPHVAVRLQRTRNLAKVVVEDKDGHTKKQEEDLG